MMKGLEIGGPYAPYFQSERHELYQKKLNELMKRVCLSMFLHRARARKKTRTATSAQTPPRYDRTCMNLSDKKS